MRFSVIPARAGIHLKHLVRRLAWIPACAGMTIFLLSACAHQAKLMTPTEAKKAAVQKQKAAERKAKNEARKAAKEAESQEVTVP